MERAGKFIRRSGARLKSLGGGHSDLVVLISELKCTRATVKALMASQSTVAEDLLKWSVGGDNRAIQDAATQITELNLLWSEVQKEFAESLKDFKHQFEMILEGEQHTDIASANLSSCEQRELKLKKELKKASRAAGSEEIKQLELKLAQAERAKDLAQLEAMDRLRENEAIKLIRFKEGLLCLSEAYIRLACKCQAIFEAQRDVASQLPDVHDCDLSEIKYTGAGASKLAVMRAKERVHAYRPSHNHMLRTLAPDDEPPPPYSPYSNTNDYIALLVHTGTENQIDSHRHNAAGRSQFVPASHAVGMCEPKDLVDAMYEATLQS